MALKVVWTDEAKEGLAEIVEYLEKKWTEKELMKFFSRLEECLDKIKEAPHRQKDSLRKPGTKEYQHSSQTTIFYSYNEKVVHILRLWTNFKDTTAL